MKPGLSKSQAQAGDKLETSCQPSIFNDDYEKVGRNAEEVGEIQINIEKLPDLQEVEWDFGQTSPGTLQLLAIQVEINLWAEEAKVKTLRKALQLRRVQAEKEVLCQELNALGVIEVVVEVGTADTSLEWGIWGEFQILVG